MFDAGAQGERAGAGFQRVARQVEQQLVQAIGIAEQVRHAGVVVVAPLRGRGFGLQQVGEALQQLMDVDRPESRGAVVVQQAVGQRAEPVGLVDDHAGQRLQVVVVDPPLQQLRGAAQAGQRVFHLVRETAQGGRQRRAGGQRLGQHVQLQQQAVVERLQRDVRADLAAVRRRQRHRAPLRRPLRGQYPRRPRRGLVTVGKQQRQRLPQRVAHAQFQPFHQRRIEPAQTQPGVGQHDAGRQLLCPCLPRRIAHCTIMGNVSIWCKC